MTSIYSADNLACSRHSRQLFANVSFSLKAGDILFIEGQNGAGKSSLLRLLTGLATPETGDIYWHNQSIQQNMRFLNALHYVGHSNGVKSGLTVNENLDLMEKLATEPCVAAIQHRDHILSRLKLLNDKNTLVKNLSAGQRRRVALAKLLLIPKSLWVLDEPLTALDVDTQTLFLQAIEHHAKNDGIVIISSHQPLSISQPVQTLRLSSC